MDVSISFFSGTSIILFYCKYECNINNCARQAAPYFLRKALATPQDIPCLSFFTCILLIALLLFSTNPELNLFPRCSVAIALGQRKKSELDCTIDHDKPRAKASFVEAEIASQVLVTRLLPAT